MSRGECVSDDDRQLQELIDEAKNLNARLGQSVSGNGGNAQIHINAGGVGLWVAITACIVQFVMTCAFGLLVTLVWFNDKDRMHQNNALYQSVPGLRELVSKRMKEIEEEQKNE
jgi:hypothetical protein